MGERSNDALSVNFDPKLATKFEKNTFDYCSPRKILVLFWNWKAWLRSQGLNMGSVSLN